MTYYGAKQMADSWRTVRQNTIQIAHDIPADQYGFRATPETMTVAELLAHMAMAANMHMQIHLVDRKPAMQREDFERYRSEAKAYAATLTTKDAIIDALTERGDDFATRLESATDEQLSEMVGFPGGAKSRFELLLGIKEHEMHHRAQLMLIERLLGIVPHTTRARQQQQQQQQQHQQQKETTAVL